MTGTIRYGVQINAPGQFVTDKAAKRIMVVDVPTDMSKPCNDKAVMTFCNSDHIVAVTVLVTMIATTCLENNNEKAFKKPP